MELSENRRVLLEKYLQTRAGQAAISIPKRPAAAYAPLSYGQQQMWLLAQLMVDHPVYNECVTVHLPGPLHTAIFEQSFNAILARHEAWRTSFPTLDGQPVQLIHPSLTLALPVIDLRHLPSSAREAEALRLAAIDATKPFDLARGPLLRAILLRLDDEDRRLYLTLHHIIFDGFSLYQVFLPELRSLYEAALAGQPSPLVALPIQYADFATWQRAQQPPIPDQRENTSSAFAKQLAYWQQQLAGSPTSLALPTDRPPSTTPTYRGAMYAFALPPQLAAALKAVSKHENVTFFTLLATAFQLLLHRYSGQDDILIGTAISDRRRPETQKLMGFFLNTLVLRAQMTGNPSFRQLLEQMRETIIDAQEHQDVPFEYLVQALQPERNPGQNPLFQVMLTLEPPLAVLPSGWTITQMEVNTNAAKFDLFLELDDRPEGLIGHFEYSADLFDEDTIKRLASHWQTLLESIVAAPQQHISQLSIISPAERTQLLDDWNNTQTQYPSHSCVHHLFAAQAKLTPHATALVLQDQRMTYAELNMRANQLAHKLQRAGVGPEVPVGVCMDRSFAMIVALLGILKAGGAYVPLDTAYPHDRLTFMLEDSRAPVLITHEQYAGQWSQHGLQLLCLDPTWQTLSGESNEDPLSSTTADNLAYIMYTSGSTGKPKGVEIRHRSILRLVFGAHYATLDQSRTILHMAPISFDAATFEVWGSLLHGARCVLMPQRIPTPSQIGKTIHTYKVTTLWLTASLFNSIIDEAPQALAPVQQLLTGGEALSVAHIRRALTLLPATQLINGYGPTEGTTFTCCYTIPRSLDPTLRSIPIGRPISNTQVYILDHNQEPVPIGVTGELYIGGDGLARGYLRAPELTREKFIPNPFSQPPEGPSPQSDQPLLYKTGDLARYFPNGAIEFIGRIDSQIKLRGFRIEPGEIETVLKQHPNVRDALVIAAQNKRAEKTLAAYIVLFADNASPLIELQAHLQKQLPEYMIPSTFTFLDAIPLTPIGKVDLRKLPPPDDSAKSRQQAFAAPQSHTQQQLVTIWEELLHVQPIGIHDDFFQLGGHSLLAARLVDRIEKVFGKNIPLSTLFAGATIAHLAQELQQQQTDSDTRAPLISVQTGGAEPPLFYLHGDWTRSSFYCIKVSHELGPEQPFYILEPYKLDNLTVPPTFKTMAAEHLKAMQLIQPHGPYLLVGFCNGGLIAYEIAQQLLAKGETIHQLILIDPASAASPPRRWFRIAITSGSALLRLNQRQQLEWFLRLRHIRRYLRSPRYRWLVNHSLQQALLDEDELTRRRDRAPLQLSKLHFLLPRINILRAEWEGIYRWIAAGYSPRPYDGKITFIWNAQELHLRNWWLTMTKGNQTETHVIPGDHMTWRTTYLDEFARVLKRCLRHE